MKTFIITLVVLFISSIAFSQEWEYISNADFLPDVNGVFQDKMIFHPKEMHFTKDSLIVTNLINGYSVYNNTWKHISPDLIKQNISNIEELQDLDIDYINTISTKYDKSGNLWIFADRFILKFDGSQYIAFRKTFSKNGEEEFPISFNGFLIEDNANTETIELIASVFYKENDSLKYKTSIYQLSDNKFKEKIKIEYRTRMTNPYFFKLPTNEYFICFGDTIRIINETGTETNKYSSLQIFGAPDIRVANCKKTNNDSIVIFTNQLKKYTYYDGDFSVDTIVYKKHKEFSSNWIENDYLLFDIYQSKYFTMLAGTDRLYIYDVVTNNIQVVNIPKIPGESKIFPVHRIGVDSTGRLWIHYLNKGFYIYNSISSVTENINSGVFPDVWIWNVYPNPAQEVISANFFVDRDAYSKLKIELIDLNGKLVKDLYSKVKYDERQQEASIQFNIGSISAGTYFLCVSAGNSKKLKQIQIKK